MSTKIEWTHPPGFRGVTWNPVTGCTPISAGCANCYARRMAKRLAGRYGYPQDDPFRVTVHEDRFEEPWAWKKPRFCFVCSMGDLFHADVCDTAIEIILRRIAESPQHIFCLLTKRPGWMCRLLRHDEPPLPNLWLGVTAENQRTADERIPLLLDTPAAVRFVSVEPMLGAVDLSAHLSGLSWCICGAETGPGARRMNLDWARSLRDQCRDASVPFFFKQAGPKGTPIPDDLMVREWPKEITRDAHTG